MWKSLPASADANFSIPSNFCVLRLVDSLLPRSSFLSLRSFKKLYNVSFCVCFFFSLTLVTSSSVKLIHRCQHAAPVPQTQAGKNFPCRPRITVARVTWRYLQLSHAGDQAGPGVPLTPPSQTTPQTLGGSLGTTHFDKTYGENADLSRETRHWIWTKALIRAGDGSPEQVSMFLAYSTSPVLPSLHTGRVKTQVMLLGSLP